MRDSRAIIFSIDRDAANDVATPNGHPDRISGCRGDIGVLPTYSRPQTRMPVRRPLFWRRWRQIGAGKTSASEPEFPQQFVREDPNFLRSTGTP